MIRAHDVGIATSRLVSGPTNIVDALLSNSGSSGFRVGNPTPFAAAAVHPARTLAACATATSTP